MALSTPRIQSFTDLASSERCLGKANWISRHHVEIHCVNRGLTRSCLVMKMNRLLLPISALCALWLINLSAAEPNSPQTPKKPVTDEYQGVKVEDDYQWLEKDDDPAVKAWSDAQNQRTRKYLDKLPDRAAIEKQLTDWYRS